jgi:hypothetical protein
VRLFANTERGRLLYAYTLGKQASKARRYRERLEKQSGNRSNKLDVVSVA